MNIKNQYLIQIESLSWVSRRWVLKSEHTYACQNALQSDN